MLELPSQELFGGDLQSVEPQMEIKIAETKALRIGSMGGVVLPEAKATR